MKRFRVEWFDLSSFTPPLGWRDNMIGMRWVRVKTMIRGIVTLLLLGLLTACGVAAPTPSSSIVQRAIALEVAQTQQELTYELRLNSDRPPQIEIKRVAIAEQAPLVIQNLPAYHLRGTYNFTLKLSKRQVTQQDNPFDLYLQRQKEGKTWRIAHLLPGDENTEPTWVTQLVQ